MSRVAQRRPRVIAFAMVSAPGRGSESAAGWGLPQAAIRFADCVVITSSAYGAEALRWKANHPKAPIDFVVVPLSILERLLKFHRIGRFLSYLVWQRRAAKVGRRLHAQRPFDAAFHVAFSAYWLPAAAVDLGIPSVWGPVGGAVRSPLRLWPGLGIPGIMGEILDLVAVRASTLLPATRRTWRRATVRLLNNKESLDALPKNLPGSSKVLNNAAFVRIDAASPRPRERYVVFPSPLDPRKGPRLALQAMLHTKPDVRLLFAADGIERGPLERMAKRLGLADRVEILGWIPRPQMFELLAGAAASIHVGLREEGGAALCEAMLHGTPVVVLAHGGARTLAEVNTDPSRVALIPPRSFAETARAIGRAIDHFADNLSTAQTPTIDQEHYQRSLQEAFENALGQDLKDTPLVEGEPQPVEATPKG